MVILHLHWLMTDQRLLKPGFVLDRFSNHFPGRCRLPSPLHPAGGNDSASAVGH